MFSKLLLRIKAMPAKTWAWIALSLTIFLSLFFFAALRQLRFDYNFEKFFPNHDPQTKFYHAHRTRFESDNDFLLLAIEHKEGIYHLDFLKKIEQLSNNFVMPNNRRIDNYSIIYQLSSE
jgi:predicted RND superfamily exporter protein